MNQPEQREESMNHHPKPFMISKIAVWKAYQRIRANRGSPGVDGQTIEMFEENLSGNLYKLWNRMASGSYMPPPVRRVEIPKATGGTRPLGIPTVADRIAQMVVKDVLEPILEPHFHNDSYGYRPHKSAHDALRAARQRCWRSNWVLDVDIKGFFDNIDHDLLMKAVCKHTRCKWTELYIRRWLTAPVQMPDGTLHARDRGTPQGGVISPLLANLFLHYAFDLWMTRQYPDRPFERYADDIVIHCNSQAQAIALRNKLEHRLAECKLELSQSKTKIVYCKDGKRRGNYPDISFDFLGYTFRPRKARAKDGVKFLSFMPAISGKASKMIRQTIRGWKWQQRTTLTAEEVARRINPILRGWITYYGCFYRSALYPVLAHVDLHFAKWLADKYKRLRGSRKRAFLLLRHIRRKRPGLFVHWCMAYKS
ncbi:group II intron reverse transcriptase/maturase [Escherichia coli]|uniref:group II intron reverse transcriptase/maturase n=1 Tax=Escherichia coli TaxID=562 RepID=UPI00181DD5FB|nr:group II intron reverse transcriptase/maturase [Escherichia coli]EEQ1693756.1 group II intron reverse transcriptase/maturase [Escherichia coli]EEQ3869826.1 group II intron reverse transcriptase/maturase [Escherichia coli]EEQ9136474.1 group II intron reverse transcriptase/maturase [Escherichia coli]EER9122988.1 group II intron reverse transcriptase/maturase [Escherichia coli]EEW8019229.1 group II intron reverse transcriptase/maturase [Escherichia coli]